ncbi:hypothetical protein E2P81_ATG01713 [Venturia nashicola]|uniref:DUF7598 domain-containing protein n=1 Tax=Venturia nashicola TaxID=86259 RepID=A0A4Z1P0S8_9PEZI|nr:hypothetical protein E6O75_ATG01754 [Venturia nashicola]TLD18985.1 hypothetical protein E2P81_ATG01713 [Venturia nashicola]
MPLTSKRLAGPGFIILNVLRAINIIALLSVIAASMIMVIKTFTASKVHHIHTPILDNNAESVKFFFFDGATHCLTAISSMFLVVSECAIFKSWFQTNWPVLSNSHSFNFLGLAMVVLGINLLGNLNKEATSQKSIGIPFWRVVIGSGIIVFIMGWINILMACGRNSAYLLGVTARQIRSKGIVAITDREIEIESAGKPGNIVASFSYAPSSHYSESPVKNKSPVRNLFRQARQSFLPSYRSEVPPYPNDTPVTGMFSPVESPKSTKKNALRRHDEQSTSPAPPMEISAPMNVNPQFAHLVRPDIAYHPSTKRADGAF